MSIETVVKELILLVCFTVNIFVLQRLVVKLVPKYLQTGEGVNKYWKKVKGGGGGVGQANKLRGSKGIFWEQTTKLFPFISSPCLHVK